jgi:hypothetical protein
MKRLCLPTLLCALAVGAWRPALAQGIDGYASIFTDVLPDVELASGERRSVAELRARLFAERTLEIAKHVRVTAAGFVDAVVADRRHGSISHAAILRPQEVHVEASWEHADLRIGLSRVAWGRLDEFQPTDVVNPQDLTRFFFEGRTEGRMPVAMIRGRLLPSDRFTVEAIYVPVFRRGRFDQLDERSSPFNLVPALPAMSREPPRTLKSGQGGIRASATTGRIDWSISTYRGFEPLPVYTFDGVTLIEEFPRYTMIGGDFETVYGPWGLRGEVAAFGGDSLEGGVGVDRKAGVYRISSSVIVTRQSASGVTGRDRTDTTIVASLDRSFARETRSVRAFAVYNPGEQSAFARVIAGFNLRDDVLFETSGGWFTGAGDDSLSRFATRDFVYARLKVFF